MRIAWIGGATEGGGVGGFGRDLLRALTGAPDVELKVYATALRRDTDEDSRIRSCIEAQALPNVAVHIEPIDWDWERWYSRHAMGVFLSSFWARKQAHGRLIRRLVADHRQQPFDVIVQFSQIELFGLRKHLPELAPVLLFPCVHAAGELRWHRRESRYARRSEPAWRHWIVRLNLMQRAWLQRRDTRAVSGVIGMSSRFNELVAEDYGVDPSRQAVIYQPMSCKTESSRARQPDEPIRLLYVGRISVRKGIELLVDLSHRLDDFAGQVELRLIGGPSFWSDYAAHLKDLNPRIGQYLGARPHPEVIQAMAEADVLLVPSHYEPGGIVVAEALARGCYIVATNEVGSAEPLSEVVCTRFESGNPEAFEAVVRDAVRRLRQPDEAKSVRCAAIQEANRCYASEETRSALLDVLHRAARGEPIRSAMHPAPREVHSDRHAGDRAAVVGVG